MAKNIEVVPIWKSDANDWIEATHSHLGKPHAYTWCLAVRTIGEKPRIVCVCTAGQAAARMLCDGFTAEINRVASDGTQKYAASMAIGAMSRALREMGYRRIVSYTLLGESGTSYKAAGWWPTGVSSGGTWERIGYREGFKPQQAGEKVRWEFGPGAPPRDPAIEALVKEWEGKIKFEVREPPKRHRPKSALGKMLAARLRQG